MYSSIFCTMFSKVCGGFLAKNCAIDPGRSPLIIASMTISFGTVGAWALSRRKLRTYACKYSSWSCVHWNKAWAVTGLGSYQHILQLLPWRDRSQAKRRIWHLSHTPDCHDDGFRHDSCVATIWWYGCLVAHKELLRIKMPIIRGKLRWLVGWWPWGSLQFFC
jgi:hypothetical protein